MGRSGLPLRTAGVVRLLRLWLAGTAIIAATMAVWAFAPVLVLVALLTAILGGIASAMILLAQRLRAWRERR
jgi:hypothetical protein